MILTCTTDYWQHSIFLIARVCIISNSGYFTKFPDLLLSHCTKLSKVDALALADWIMTAHNNPSLACKHSDTCYLKGQVNTKDITVHKCWALSACQASRAIPWAVPLAWLKTNLGLAKSLILSSYIELLHPTTNVLHQTLLLAKGEMLHFSPGFTYF